MSRIVVCDTGPLIALALVELLPVLPRLFAEVLVPEAVIEEATRDLQRPGAKAIAHALENGFLRERKVEIDASYLVIADLLDRGEAEALTLAKQVGAVALIDERRGRKVAENFGIPMTGTAAVLILAKRRREIPEVRSLLGILSEAGYRMSGALIADILQRCDEVRE